MGWPLEQGAIVTRRHLYQREALILVGASGFSYEEAAETCGCAVGTIKSRVSRARTQLGQLLSLEGDADYGPDAGTAAVTSKAFAV